ncbi:uncharacterized protein [Haliotis asinina]|uniref:uncharacterized protein n=1 Tax=Haliotis asinina TaxID=109174 RepID=UPI00353184BD
MDNEFEKKSIRENFLERRRCAMQVSTLNAASKVVAADMRKGQNEMRRRLQKYRDRQREISEKRDGPLTITMEEFLERQMRLHKLKTSITCRPLSSPLIQRMSKLINEAELDKEAEEFNMDAFTDRRRAKIDLRPSTAVTCPSRLSSREQTKRGARISTGQKEVRYYEDEEIRDRTTFYSQLLQLRKKQEHDRFQEISSKVDTFCGKHHHTQGEETWRPMGEALNTKYNKSWVKPISRPPGSRPLSGSNIGTQRPRRVSAFPPTRTAWTDHYTIPKLRSEYE